MKGVRPGVLLIATILLVAAGWLLRWWLGNSVTGEGEAPTSLPESPVAVAPVADATAAPAVALPAPERESVPSPQQTPLPERRATFAQGLHGLAVDADQRPLADVQVYLLESLSNAPLALPVLVQQGLPMGPLAETRTGADGTFAIGLQLANETIYELRLVSPRHADTRLGDLRVLPGEWHDVGAVVLRQGTVVRGRVTVAGTSIPVPQAIVTIEAGTTFEDLAVRALPGRERGLSAIADALGDYEIRNAPSRGVVVASAAAPGFARVQRQNLELDSARPLAVDFALPPGHSIRGRLVDDRGQPIARGRVEAWPMQTAAPASVAISRIDGQFEVLGLVVGNYRLRTLARGFQDLELLDVAAGRSDLELVLRPRTTLTVRALDPEQRVLRRYHLGVRRSFPNAADPLATAIGLVAEVPDQRVRLDGLTDRVQVPGLPAGLFQVEVTAEGYAKTLSAPFEVLAFGQPVSLDVVVSPGSTLRGVVLDEAGQPLAGATVETQPNGATPDNPFYRAVASAAPDKVTRTKVTTGADGSFLLPRLATAAYQLQVDHPDCCRIVVRDLRVEPATDQSVPPIRLPIGASVSGRATVGGKVQGQMVVVLTTIVDPLAPREVAAAALRLEAVTDSTGAYQMPRRVPPGQYELRAKQTAAADPDAQIFQQLLQLQRSSTNLSVAPGQRQVERHIDLPTDH